MSTFTNSKVTSYFTVPNIENVNVFDVTNSEFKVFCALRKLTYENKNFLLLTGAVKDGLLTLLSKSYSCFKPIQRIINNLKNYGIISIQQSGRYPQITFLETLATPDQQPCTPTKGAISAPPIYISKEISKEDKDVIPNDIHKNSFILTNTDTSNTDKRMNEPSVKIIRTDDQTLKLIKTNKAIDNSYIKTLEQLPEFKKYSTEAQATIHKYIHKAKSKNISLEIIDAYCRSIIFNKMQANIKSPKYKPIISIKNYSHAALFGKISVYHRIDNPNFPFDVRTQEEIANEQRLYEKEEKKTIAQQVLKVVVDAQDNFLTKLKHLKDLFKENFDALLAKAKQAVAKAKDYNPLFVPEFEAIEELYNNRNIYNGHVVEV